MSLSTLFLAVALIPQAEPKSAGHSGGLLAIRVGRAETAAKGAIEHAVILVEDGKIVMVGEDLPIERGIPILDKPDWVAMPGLVDAYSRLGLDGEGGDDNSPEARAFDEVYADTEEYEKLVEYGVTTLGLYPPGNGIPGQAVAIRPVGKTAEAMKVADPAYLKIILRAAQSSKKLVKEGFKRADEYEEKEKKAREKWEKDQEAKKKKAAPKKDEKAPEKKDEKKEDAKEEKKEEDKKEGEDKAEKTDKKDDKPAAKEDVFVPPEPDPKVKPFLDLRAGKLRALFSISGAAEYLHLLEALGKEKISFDLRIPLTREIDIFYVADKKTFDLEVDGIGDRKCRVVIEPILTLHPGTMRQRNPAMELARAGAKVVFIPRNDTLPDFKSWLPHVGEMVAAGLDREAAIRAMTIEPAGVLGIEERLGSLEKGKDANLVFLSGDPFQPSTRIRAVMLEGRFVFGEVNL